MKKRFAGFLALSIVSAAFTLIFAASLCGLAAINTDFAENVGEVTLDGEDFTPIFKAGAGLMDIFVGSVVPVLLLIVYILVLILLNAAAFGFYRLFGLRVETRIGEEELSVTRRIYAVFSVAAAVVTTVFSICGAAFFGSSPLCFFGLLFCWQYPLFAWAFCLRRLKKLGETESE